MRRVKERLEAVVSANALRARIAAAHTADASSRALRALGAAAGPAARRDGVAPPGAQRDRARS